MATQESLELTESIDNKRYYNITKDAVVHKLPSVTTIIGAMTDNSSIEMWRKRVGEAEADRITRFSANRGTCMHQKLEYWFTSDIKDERKRMLDVNQKMDAFVRENSFTAEEYKCGNELFYSLMVCGFFDRVGRIVEMEDTLYSFTYGGYAGRVDCVYESITGDNVLLDFKTARHKKRRDWIQNYYYQLGAYFVAYYQMYKVKLDYAELWIAVENDSPQLVHVSQQELIESAKVFLNLVKAYHAKYDYLLNL